MAQHKRSLTAALVLLHAFCSALAGVRASSGGRSLQQRSAPQRVGGPAAAATRPYSTAPAPAPAQAARGSGTELLFVQRAARAHLALDSTSPTARGVLTLSDADLHTTWFTDKPERRAGMLGSAFFATHAGFYSGADWLGAPNAVLTGQAPGGAPVTVVLTLDSPAFSAANASLTYKVTLIPAAPEVFAASVDADAPRALEVQGASLFIDPWYGRYGGGGYPGGWWWGGPTYSGNIGQFCPDCWDDKGDRQDPLPVPTPFPPSVNDQVPMPPVHGPRWAWETLSVHQCTNCTVDADGRHICSSCDDARGAGGRRRLFWE